VSIYVAPRAKAIVGPGAATMTTNPPLAAGLFMNSPQMLMRSYWLIAHRNPWINAAERLVSGKVSGVTWHLEVDGEEIEGGENPITDALLQLLEKPQANLAIGRKITRRELWNLTSRYMGLCGPGFWLLDERNALGIPNSLLSIRPDRLTPAEDAKGNLTGWVLDASLGATVNGEHLAGIAIELDQILQFPLIPPDEGHYGMGLVEAAIRKGQLVELSDTYAAGTLASGGRLSGLITGTQQSPIPDEVFKQLVRDLRAVTEQPDAARRTTVLQGEVNWKPTGMTPLDMALTDLMKLTRDDIFGIWGTPFSIVYGGSQATGLNSGDSRKYDEAALWQGPVHDRLTVFREVIQFQLLDRYGVELVIEEPEFDDDSPRYDLLGKSVNTPLTNKERRELIGLDPFGDPRDDEVWLPATMVQAFTAPGDETPPSPTETVLGRTSEQPDTDTTDEAVVAAGETATANTPGKATLHPRVAGLHKSLTTLRANLDRSQTPRIREAVAKVLDRQKAEIARKVREHAGHLAAKPKDTDPWWDAEKWDKALHAALSPFLTATAENVSAHIATVLEPRPGKASPVEKVLTRGAARVTKINQTTRDGIVGIIAQGIDDGLSPAALGDAIEAWSGFDEYRSELIARTEMMDAYNAAALGSYDEAGLTQVQAIDGDGDPECAERDGQVFDIDEADTIEDHPNGTLDWVPVIGEYKAAPLSKAEPIEVGPRTAHAAELYLAELEAAASQRQAKADAAASENESRLAALVEQFAALTRETLANREAPIIHVNVPDMPTPVVNVKVDAAPAPEITVHTPEVTVNVPEGPKRVVKTVLWDEGKKRIAGSIEERA
jgi:phage portal protein BeeE